MPPHPARVRPARTRRPPGTLTASLGAALAALWLVAGCAGLRPDSSLSVPERVERLLPADVLILGERHDDAAHHRIEHDTVQALAARGWLAALALEMADSGRSTAGLPRDASAAQVRAALAWDTRAWPWDDYAPAVMAAVAAGAPVLGANLPRERMKDAMADVSLDAQLPEPALAAQRAAVRDGHCGLLPESQIQPMTRIQIARDRAMAQVVQKARQPGRTVLLLTGAGHALRSRGVVQHLPTDLRVLSVALQAEGGSPPGGASAFDRVWTTPADPGAATRDDCAPLRQPRARP